MQYINEAKRWQKLAGINEAADPGVNILPGNMILDKSPRVTSTPSKPLSRPDGKYKVQLQIDGKPVMGTSADSDPSPEELSDIFDNIRRKYGSEFDFSKAELITLDPSGKQISSYMTKDRFLQAKTTSIGWSGEPGHGTV
jgi:hypothetical protein